MKNFSKKQKRIIKGIGIFIFLCIIVGVTSEKPEYIKKLLIQTNKTQNISANNIKEKEHQGNYTKEKNETNNTSLEVLQVQRENNGYINHISGLVKNNTGRNYSYVRVTFNLYDKSGMQIGTSTDSIQNLKSGDTWKFKTVILGKEFDEYKVSDITAY